MKCLDTLISPEFTRQVQLVKPVTEWSRLFVLVYANLRSMNYSSIVRLFTVVVASKENSISVGNGLG